MNVLRNDFIDPFSTDLDSDKLYNLASGSYLPDDVAESLLSVQERETLSRDTFFERLNSESANETRYFSPIKRVEWKSFTDVSKLKISAKGKSKEITVQRDILGILAAKSQQHNAAICVKALCYPLAPVPLSMATCDGIILDERQLKASYSMPRYHH